jgi:hypothetical protein
MPKYPRLESGLTLLIGLVLLAIGAGVCWHRCATHAHCDRACCWQATAFLAGILTGLCAEEIHLLLWYRVRVGLLCLLPYILLVAWAAYLAGMLLVPLLLSFFVYATAADVRLGATYFWSGKPFPP